MIDCNFSLKEKLNNYKMVFLKSKKYWTIYLIIILIAFFSLMDIENYAHPKMEVFVLIISSILGVFFISLHQRYGDEKNFYKTVFIILLLFGIVFSFLTPIMCTHDEVEHFVRAEMTSNGIITPEYNKTAVFYVDGKENIGQYLTIQSTLDLTEKGKPDVGYDKMDIINSSIFNTEADTQPINNTLVPFASAFAQNPFFGYIMPAIGMAIAKLLDLNAIWLLWLGRIFNSLLYALLVSYAIKKTPILKMPLFIIACIPAALSQTSSVSIDAIINGLAILSIAIFLVYYKSPKKSLDYKAIIKFTIIILLMGLCKVTYFSFIFLLLFIPIENFKEKKHYYYGILSIILITIIFGAWSKFVVDPAVHNSARYHYYNNHNVNTTNQISYILNHKKQTAVAIAHLFTCLERDLKCQSFFNTNFSSLYLLFLGSVFFLYPHEKINLKTRLGTLLVFAIMYFGTYILFLLSWNPVGDLHPTGVQSRYFFPALGLLPIGLGFNHMISDMSEINQYLLMITLAFIVLRILTLTILVY